MPKLPGAFKWLFPWFQVSQTSLPNELVGTLWWPKEVMMLDRSKRDNNHWFCHMVKASLSVKTRNIKTVAYRAHINSIKKSISLTAKFIIFPVFWWHESQKIRNVTDLFFTFFLQNKVETKKLYHREDPYCRICLLITVSFKGNLLKWKLQYWLFKAALMK